MGRRGRAGKTCKSRTEEQHTSSEPVSSSSSASEDDGVEFDPTKLSIVVEGQSKSFNEWTLEYAQHYYPHIGHKTYRVPPLEFNTQPLVDDILLGFAQLGTQKEENRKKDRSQADVGFMFEELGRRLERSADDERKGLFIVSSAHYDNYLSDLKSKGVRTEGKEPPLPREVAPRGELDLLVLHPHTGIVLVQVKGVGLPDSWQPSKAQRQAAVQRKVEEAETQLRRDEVVLHHVMKDLHLRCHVHSVVALPFVTRNFLHQSHPGGREGSEPVYLCSEDVASNDAMFSWWMRYIGQGQDKDLALSDLQFKSIVGRYCGLLSTVSVWCKSSLRVEVRDVAEAADEVGARFSNLVLTTEQRTALDCQQQLVYLHGPPGAGKSVMLVIKARQWLLKGHDVMVLNFDFGREGNPVGHYIHDSIYQWLLQTVNDSKSAVNVKQKREKDTSNEAKTDFSIDSSDKKHSAKAKRSKKKSKASSSNGHCSDAVEKTSAEQRAVKVEPEQKTYNNGPVIEGKSPSQTHVSSNGIESVQQNIKLHSASFDSSSESSKSDAENVKDRKIGKVFKVDCDLGMNFDSDQFKVKLPELMQNIKQLIRPGVPCHFVWDEFYWKDRLMPIVDELGCQFPDSCIWSAEVSPDKAPEGFTKIMLTTVLRCPPTVQTLLQRVDWMEAHKHLYTSDSTLQGLPTDGFKPKLIEHKFHQAQSPLDCIQCADNLLNFFHEELKLDFGNGLDVCVSSVPCKATDKNGSNFDSSDLDSGSPTSFPNHGVSVESVDHGQKRLTKTLPIPKDKIRKKCCTPRRVKFKDIVVLFSYPSRCLNRPSNLFIVRETLQHLHHQNISNSIFLRRMTAAGLPVTFCAPNSDAQEIALPMEDKVLFSVTNALTGLERKVVIYVPVESKTYQYPAEMIKPESVTSKEQSVNTIRQADLQGAQPPYPLMTVCHKDDTDMCMKSGLGRQESISIPVLTEIDVAESRTHADSVESSAHTDSAESRPQTDSVKSRTHTDSVEYSAETIPTSGVPSALSEEDWARIEDRMLEQNQRGMFYAASRCLSVFVLIIP